MTGKLKICNFGKNMLQIFYVTTLLAAIYLILGFCGFYERWFANGPAGITVEKKYWLIRLCIIFLVEITIFWIGMISVYLTSQQLGIRWRVLGLICGWIPIAHLVMLHIIIRTVRREVKFEKLRAKRNAARADEQICKTKYPILMVHGVFFRDFEHLNYWGRIPGELIKNGAEVYYGAQQSAATVMDYEGYYYYCNNTSITRAMNYESNHECFVSEIYSKFLADFDISKLSEKRRRAIEYTYIANMVNALITYDHGCKPKLMKKKYEYVMKDMKEKFPDYKHNPYIGIFKPRGAHAKVRVGVGILMGLQRVKLDLPALYLISLF